MEFRQEVYDTDPQGTRELAALASLPPEHAALPGDISTLFTQAQIDLISDPQFKSWMQYLLGELGIFGSRVPVPTNAT